MESALKAKQQSEMEMSMKETLGDPPQCAGRDATSVSFAEFARAFIRRAYLVGSSSNVIQLRIAFAAFDQDGDGVLTVSEFADAMSAERIAATRKSEAIRARATASSTGRRASGGNCDSCTTHPSGYGQHPTWLTASYGHPHQRRGDLPNPAFLRPMGRTGSPGVRGPPRCSSGAHMRRA